MREMVDHVPEQPIEYLQGKVDQCKNTLKQLQHVYDSVDGKLEGKQGQAFQESLSVVKAIRSKISGVMDNQRSQMNEYNKQINIKNHLKRGVS